MQHHRRRAPLAILATALTLALTWLTPLAGSSTGSSPHDRFPALTAATGGHGVPTVRTAPSIATAGHRAYRVLTNTGGPAGEAGTLVPPLALVVGLVLAVHTRWRAQPCPGGPVSRGPPALRPAA